MICVYVKPNANTHSTMETAFVGVAINCHKYWLAVRHYAHYRITNNFLSECFHFIFSDGKQSFEAYLIVLLGILLFNTNSSLTHMVTRRKYKVHL